MNSSDQPVQVNLMQDGRSVGRGALLVGARAWHVALGVGLLPAVLYVLAPYGLFASTVYVLAALVAAGTLAFAVQRRGLYQPLAWALIATALGLAAIGHVIWYGLDLLGLEPFPSVADVFYLAVYPLLMAALWMLGRDSGSGDGALSDALIVGVSAAVLIWALLIAPHVHDPDLTMLQLVVSAAYPVADLILLPLVLRLVFLHRTRVTAHVLLLPGMLAYLAADLLYAHGNAVGWYAPGGWIDSLWLIAYALVMAAVWHPSAAVKPVSSASQAELSSRRLLILAVASISVPALILVTAGTDLAVIRAAALGSILLFILVMFRLAGLMNRAHRQADVLEHLAQTDPLTGTANRRHLEHELAREIARAERTGTPLNLVFLDLDRFKQFNDTHGHGAGDVLLQELVDGWRKALRPTDVLARTGGEEFVVVLPDTGLLECTEVVERLRGLVPQGQTCSAGIATFRPGETAEDLVRRADEALYRAKQRGRDRYELADPPA